MIAAGISVGVFLLMELVVWIGHKYVMHGFLWALHRDHHVPSSHKAQRNDVFSLIFPLPSVALCIAGTASGIDFRFWIGIGIALYGLTYFLLHDTLVHGRTRLLRYSDNFYFRAIVRAHNDHHVGKENYGMMFMFPRRYFKNDHQVH